MLRIMWLTLLLLSSSKAASQQKILVFTTPNYKILFDRMVDTLQPDSNGFEIIVENYSKGAEGFGTSEYWDVIRGKVQFIAQQLGAAKDGEYLIVADADIQYFDAAKLHKLVQHASSHRLDFYGMAEGRSRSEYNGGFYIVHNNARLAAFYDEVNRRLLDPQYSYIFSPGHFAEQELMNDMLTGDDPWIWEGQQLRHAQIPHQFCIHGPCSSGYPTKEAVLHHAVWASTVEAKLLQMINVRAKWQRVMDGKDTPLTLALKDFWSAWHKLLLLVASLPFFVYVLHARLRPALLSMQAVRRVACKEESAAAGFAGSIAHV